MWDWAKCINVCSALLITKITLVSKIKKINKCYKNSNSQQFIYAPAYSITECLFTLGANSQPWWQRLFALTPPTNMWLVNITKDLVICSSGADGKACDVLILMRSTHPPVGKLFFSLQISCRIGKAFIFNKMKGIIKKLKMKYRVGLWLYREGFIVL